MQPRDFCFWLNGYFDLTEDNSSLSGDQLDVIKEHLDLVFDKQIQSVSDIKKEEGTNQNNDMLDLSQFKDTDNVYTKELDNLNEIFPNGIPNIVC